MIKAKCIVESEAFLGRDSKLKHELVEVVNTYENMFLGLEGLSPKMRIQYDIQLQQDAPLPNICMYGMLVLENAEIKKKIQEFLDKGVTRPSTSPCEPPIFLFLKRDGTWCMCVDFRYLNKVTVNNQYHLPHIDDLLDILKDVVYFTRLDMRRGYHQIRIVEDDIWKTTFKIK